MQSDLTNSGKHYNLSIPSNQDNTVCLYEDTQEFKNPFLQEDNSGNDLGFSAYGFNQNLWINWEQSNPFDCNFVCDNTFQTARIDKFKVLPDSGSVLHHTDVYNNMKNMKEEYYDEHKPENCNVHNSKDDVLVYSRKSLIDQACSPYSCQTKDTLQTTIQSPFLLKSANGVVKYGSKIQAQGFEQNIPSNIDEMVEDILTSTMPKSKNKARDTEPRKDLVSKNIIRIISRFFKDKIKDLFPDISLCFQDPELLIYLLQEFCRKLFPKHEETKKSERTSHSILSDKDLIKAKGPSNLTYILGAFALGSNINKLNIPKECENIVENILKCLSKYTHKNLKALFQSEYCKIVFYYFFSEGKEYFSKQQIVQAHRQLYEKKLYEFQISFECNSEFGITNIDRGSCDSYSSYLC